HVHYLRTMADSEDIISRLDGVERVAVVGAGFIGLEVAASLRHRGIAVTVIAPEDVPLATIIGEELGRFVADRRRGHGVECRVCRVVESVTEAAVVLDDGSSAPADLVVVGSGVVPRVGLAGEAGLEVDRGVLVAGRLRSSDGNSWAAGDIAS